MCIICTDWEKGNLTIKEAWRNLREMAEGSKTNEELVHFFEVAEILSEKQNEEKLNS